MKIQFVIFLATALVSGCAAYPNLRNGPSTTEPRREDFPDASISFSLDGSVDQVRSTIADYLSSIALPYMEDMDNSHTYLITAFDIEQGSPTERRTRRTAYLFQIQISPSITRVNGHCSDVALKWFVQSKGDREDEWSQQPADTQYQPTRRTSLASFLSSKKCGRP